MPTSRNLRGGKAFKKGKKAPTGDAEKVDKFFGRDEDQDYARVIAMLGNRRVRCFCNDAKERICKIRGSMCKGPKKQKIEVGDIVLISYRDFAYSSDEEEKEAEAEKDAVIDLSGAAAAVKKNTEIADIIGKYSRSHWRDIRKEPGVHHRLFIGDQQKEAFDELFDTGDADAEAEVEANEENIDVDAV